MGEREIMDYKEVFDQGYDAYLDELTLVENPWNDGFHSEQWILGWKSAEKSLPAIHYPISSNEGTKD